MRFLDFLETVKLLRRLVSEYGLSRTQAITKVKEADHTLSDADVKALSNQAWPPKNQSKGDV